MKQNAALPLAKRVRDNGLIIAPGIFDMISVKLADAVGFDALYMTGYGVTASHLGLPDAGIASYTDMVGRVARIKTISRTPLTADGDTGYGHVLGRLVVPLENMVAKIKVAVERRDSSVYGALKAAGSSDDLETPLYPFEEFSELMGLDEVAAFDAAHDETR